MKNMKNSNSSFFQKESQRANEQQNQLPEEWDYLSKRLAQVEKGLTIIEKKYIKLQKKLNNSLAESSQHNTQLVQQIINIKKNMITKIQFKQDLLRQIQNIQNQIKSSCNNFVQTKLQRNNLSFLEKHQNIELKVKTVYDQTKAYVDRAIFQLKQLLRKYVKQQGQLQRKIQRTGRENSPSLIPRSSVTSINSLSKSKSAKKLFENTEKSQSFEKQQKNNQNWFERSKQIVTKQSSTGTGNTNRVSYLRQKLKQFQKINKKYEEQTDKNPTQNTNTKQKDKQQLVKKMKNYRQFLEQSQSQLQPSNILSQDVVGYPMNKKGNYGLF